ncbi:Probable apyrase 5 (AtAPY5) (ATP-diphosphatase) (ATP-diphosphohydrolase) (Adenosine diphosphatase) (ADPase) (NTPDase) (Nucleoside triphosphate diphosphohydrolase 5) [Durusdinium trenchii]|uniref:Probable apyrase 5 (AtAPY5) (ATP-diphosphatase) (ATP-diphosphohydrolase) (Adenosine diphosphatase) (ADPase) (NTPDase) (Nucleoside triphosphate diphosphohydrolase 5) n=1 Tax=Durusdinium trenchii TaxID=1381693 RepID=A0ABP0M180_9DINO
MTMKTCWCLLILRVLAQPALRKPSTLEQALVFDAGSSGTRIHIFNMYVQHGKAVPSVDLSVRDNQTWKVKPGLSHFARSDDLQGAGLRAVPSEKAKAVLETVRSTLLSSGFWFHEDWADIIKGSKEEAGLAWIAANYLHGTFGEESSSSPSLGIIEMGGGSTQVSFQIEAQEVPKVAESDTFEFRTALGKTYHLYAHSYLGFGQDYAQDKLIDLSDGNQDPCYPKGYSRERHGSKMEGVGSSQQCESNIQRLLFQESTAPGRYEYELPLRGSLIATENFFYVRQDLKFDKMEGVPPSEEEASQVCGKELASSFEKACFALSYQLAFLAAVKATDLGEVKVMRKINGGDIDWALGAALVHLLQTRSTGPGSASWIRITAWTPMPLWLTLLASIGLFFGFTMYLVRRQKCPPKAMAMKMDPTLFGAKNGLE